ncbi:sequestosome-1-like [Uloborus diversus]|uniref:sequestosome-1-like n=1 Tax=Uloborus diversus TaxID=327109 RepID=UPI002409FD81|nr:sequestosome-1-like [Uloborus diversus]
MVNVIKVYLQRPDSKKTEIRRLAVSSDIIGRFELLCVKVIELFPLLCGKAFEISWEDSEGDLILMSSDAELAQALANANDGLIKIYVSLSDEKQSDDTDKGPVGASVHPGVVCDECNLQIKGHRYKCLQCKDYDLCSTCNAASKHSHHDMLKLVEPIYVTRKWIGDLYARRMWRALFGRMHLGGAHFACSPEAEEKPSCSSKPSPSDESPTKKKWQEAFSEACKNFVPAEYLLPDAVGNLLKMGGVEVKIGGCPFAPFGGPFTHNVPQTEEASKPSEQGSSKGNNEEAKSPDVESSTAAASKPQTEEKVEAPVNQAASSSVNEAASLDATAKAVPEEKPEEKEQSLVGNEGDILSNTADGWTLLNKDDASKKTPERESSPPVEKIQEAKAERQDENHSDDPKIANALLKMHAMGFTNEGGWLERLLITKQGNINEALDALYPNTQRH